ncbi:dihydroorotase, multifunctional complex type [Beggiatoa alba B18LD]|uniref:Dihydroorotase, multifunctional complex type n=1 Tax=Beggiatoa alba B18LD TaxID=395493 RepID=I3CE51_9GAMM|nr:dihydroorotase [Beggiatoa alba]EIJ41894.1 dihydroorotase, multifunctional complex type [Beggiatoa alba B18LD]
MTAKFSLKGGRVLDPATQLDQITDVHIAEGKIVAIGDAPAYFSADWELDVSQHLVCPGLVDLSVRLREPGAEHKGTIISETRAAACNGITTLCCPPDTNPVIDTPAVAELLQKRAEEAGMAKVLPLAALTQSLAGQHLASMGDLKEAGCIGVSNASLPVENTEVLRHAMEYAATHDMTIFLQAQDAWLGRAGCMHEGAYSVRLGLAGIPEEAEIIDVARCLLLIELTGVKAHFCRLTSARAVAMIAEARERGLSVTADVSAHHLFLTDLDIGEYNSQCHVHPPLRSERDKIGLRQGLLNGAIQAICSDHQPHEADAKLSPFVSTAAGISSLDSLLPLCLQLARDLEVDYLTMLNWVTVQPARILGITAGTLTVNQPADICVINPQLEWTLTLDTMHSIGRNSPFLGWSFLGKVVHTVIDGRLVSSVN